MHKIGVAAVMRDESSKLSRFFAVMEALEKLDEISEVNYSFYENDSDDDTAIKLTRWLSTRNYSFKSEKRGWPRYRDRDKRRTLFLARARNISLRNLTLAKLDYVLLVDVDIAIDINHCTHLIRVLNENKKAVMACASSFQSREAIDTGSPTSYYDSWALIDRFGRPGISGLEIPFLDKNDRHRWLNGIPVSVQSAFGGLAVARANAIRENKALWDGNDGCEHWQFCKSLLPAGEILISPNASPEAESNADGKPFDQKYVEHVKNILSRKGIL